MTGTGYPDDAGSDRPADAIPWQDTPRDARSQDGWSVPGYRHGRELGAGASGRVVVATHEATGRQVAIKYLSAELSSDDGFRGAFRSEAELLGSLGSAHVTEFYEYVESPHGAAIVMELVPGVPLRALLREEGPTGPEAALLVLKGSLLGLAAAHRSGVVHRDYKPENVLVRPDGASKLVDFGIARRSGSPGAAADSSVSISGTPPYMAPEQWRGGPADAAGDVYAATVTFYECLTGERPYAGANLAELALQHTTAPIPLERAPEAVRGLISRGMAKDPALRPHDALTLVGELEQVAVQAYGPQWEARGQRRLAALAALIPLLFGRPGDEPAGSTDLALTRLPGSPPPGEQVPEKQVPGFELPEARMPGRPGRPGRPTRDYSSWLVTAGALLVAALVLLAGQLPSGWAGEHSGQALATSTAAPTEVGADTSADDGTGDGRDPSASPDASGTEEPEDGTGPEAREDPADAGTAGGPGTGPEVTDPTTGDDGAGGTTTDPTDPGGTADPGDPTEPRDPADPTDPTDPTDPSDPTDPDEPTDPTDPTDPAEPGTTVTRVGFGSTSVSYDHACECYAAHAPTTVHTDGVGAVDVTVQWYEMADPKERGKPHGRPETFTLSGESPHQLPLSHRPIRAYACDTWYRVEVTSGEASGSRVIYGECLG